MTPQIVAALETVAQNELFIRAVESMSWKELFGTDNIAELVHTVFTGTPLGAVIESVTNRSR